MKKILKPSFQIHNDSPAIEEIFSETPSGQGKTLEKLIEEKIERMKNYIEGLSEGKGFNLYDIIISEVERALISSVLKETKGNQLRASRILGINRNTLRKKIKHLKI
jgi:DNA-binding protein Fis